MNFALPSDQLRAVVFDLDGLMVNTEDLYSQADEELVKRRGHQLTEDVRRQMIGRPQLQSLKIMIDTYSLDSTIEQLLQESGEMIRELIATRLEPLPGLLPLLDILYRAHVPKAVATSSAPELAAKVLRRCQIAHCFHFVLTASHVEHGKPAPDIYLAAARRFKIRPQEMLVLEDSAVGCEAAVTAGAYTVAIPNRHTRLHDFPQVAFTAESLADERIIRALGRLLS